MPLNPNFRPPPPYGSTRLPLFPGWLVALGPGIIWMALAQGSGELIWWPYLCAKYGLAFLFILTPACLLQYAVTFEIGRYSALTGESIWRGARCPRATGCRDLAPDAPGAREFRLRRQTASG